MKKLLLIPFLLFCGITWAQKELPQPKNIRTTSGSDLIFLPAKPTICYSTGQTDTRIGPPPEFLRKRSGRTTATTSEFIVEYVGFSDSARVAFQQAVEIWKSIIVSPVPIRVYAIWTDLGSGSNGSIILGGASPDSYVTGFQGATKANTAYPIALAEKLAKQNLNGNSADIYCQFNSNKAVNWYLGTDGATNGSAGRQDFITVVTHELGHGLGFTSSFYATTNLAIWGDDSNYGYPRIYDHYLKNATNQQLINTSVFSNPSTQLYSQVTGRNLFFDSPIANAQNGGTKPKIYAPASYSIGSSISHLDETTYPTGSTNALMTPSLARGEVNQNPGPIVRNMFTEMGWKSTSVLHNRITDSEELLGQLIPVTAQVVSDTSVIGPVRLSYTINDTTRANATTVTMTQSGNTYTANLPASSQSRTIRYWISTTETGYPNRTFTSPAEAPSRAFWTFKIGTDNTPPTITHAPESSILSTTDSLVLTADVFDDFSFGIDTTYIEYRVNGVVRPSVGMPRLGYYVTNGIRSNNIYAVGALTFATGSLKGGDKIEYRLVARDRSKARNVGYAPASGYYTVNVAGVSAAVTEYVNDFNTTSSDFTGTNFSITTPTGFTNGAIHSDHPYKDGPESQGYEANYTYTLLKPIRLSDQDPFIRFDEICLVEPGEDGSVFGSSSFYDYVVVEGSSDGGKTWIPFQDGWDARANNQWLTGYNSKTEQVAINGTNVTNSTFAGTAGLYKAREINMAGSGNFSPGQQVLVRFRIFADQLSHGWGWAIDNLYIQKAKPIITSTQPAVTQTFIQVAPNPSQSGHFLIDADFPASVKSVDISVTNIMGRSVYQKIIKQPGSLQERLELTSMPAGTYLLRFVSETEVITKRIVITQ